MPNSEVETIERKAWALAATVTVTVVGLIWLTTSGRLPEAFVPEVSARVLEATPHLNAALVSTALLTLAVGYHAIRHGRIRRHAVSMSVTAALFFGFLVLYLVRLANDGLTEFAGPDAVYSYVYLPVLVIHMVLAAAAVPLVIFNLYVGVRAGRRELATTSHSRVGRVAAPLWGVSFVLGDLVYLMLHHFY